MKTKEELASLREEVETLNRKLAELTEEELEQISGGFIPPLPVRSSGDERAFNGTSDGSSHVVHLNIGPEEYDCSGLVD